MKFVILLLTISLDRKKKIKKFGIKQLVKGCVDIEEAINYDAEEMYKKLLKEKNKEKDRKMEFLIKIHV